MRRPFRQFLRRKKRKRDKEDDPAFFLVGEGREDSYRIMESQIDRVGHLLGEKHWGKPLRHGKLSFPTELVTTHINTNSNIPYLGWIGELFQGHGNRSLVAVVTLYS
jgi:hypothetical protein